jgi:hypothetical protein
MTNDQQSYLVMLVALKAQLALDSTVYENDVAFKAAVVAFLAQYAVLEAAGSSAHPDNSGYSREKNDGKILLAKNAANLSGRAYVTLNLQEKYAIAGQLKINPTDYINIADAACKDLAQGAHDVMASNIDDLTGYVTDAKLVDLQKNIDNFGGLAGTSDLYHELSPELTAVFIKGIDDIKPKVENLKLLGRDYESIDVEFFKRFTAATVIPTINVHHTYVAVTVTGRDSGKPIENIVCGLTNGKKSAITDWEGNAKIEEVKSGDDVLTLSIIDDQGNTKVVYTQHIKIKRGTTNSFKVVLEGR